MASRLREHTLYLAGLSMCLSLAMVGTGGRSLHVYFEQQKKNDWLLPLWPRHFDTRELEMIIATSAAVFFLNMVLAIALLVPALPANILVIGSALLSFMVEMITIVFSTIINYRAPARDTIKTWTCRWSDTYITTGDLPPPQFQGLCHKTRFAYFSTIPLLAIQTILLVLGIYAIFARPTTRKRVEDEKPQGLRLRNVGRGPHVSLESETRSYQDSAIILGAKG